MPLFNFVPAGAPKLDTLVAGFLSAQAGFAEEIGEGKIQILSFAENKFVYEVRADLIFIIVIAQDDDEHVYRLILKEVAQVFEKKYHETLAKTVIPSHIFGGFREYVMEILTKYDRVPQIQPRYPTAILPPDISKNVEKLLHKAETSPGFLRTALMTRDGYVVVSKLQTHEYEVASKQIKQSHNLELPTYFAVAQSPLNSGTKLFVHQVNEDFVFLAIIREKQQVGQSSTAITPIIKNLAKLDFSNIVKIFPTAGVSDKFSDYEVLASNPITESAYRLGWIASSAHG